MLMRIIWTSLIFLVTYSSVNASVLNGDFSAGLTAWTTVGDVTEVGGEALIKDDGAVSGYSALYQGIAMAPGDYTLEFDFSGNLSANVPFGTFPDFFATSIYFSNDIGTFNLSTLVFDDVLGLFDLDHFGVFVHNGTESAGAKGAGWSHWRVDFTNTHVYAIPTFEMFDFNFVDDSGALIDNVSISPVVISVPEPGVLALFFSGLLGVWVVRGGNAKWPL